uniref:Uncharacterized protein n=1 Tax=Sander lucioperca TaxID=283035 RepID=A0A8C9ZAG0_SANLU
MLYSCFVRHSAKSSQHFCSCMLRQDVRRTQVLNLGILGTGLAVWQSS